MLQMCSAHRGVLGAAEVGLSALTAGLEHAALLLPCLQAGG